MHAWTAQVRESEPLNPPLFFTSENTNKFQTTLKRRKMPDHVGRVGLAIYPQFGNAVKTGYKNIKYIAEMFEDK